MEVLDGPGCRGRDEQVCRCAGRQVARVVVGVFWQHVREVGAQAGRLNRIEGI